MSSNENNNEQSPPKRPPRKNNLKILEKYKIIKELGRGAFGAALLVTRHTDNKNFVMKKIDLQNMPPQEKKAAEIEVNVLKKLKHQNIVKYVESGFEESQRSGNSRFRTSHLLIVMEFANGGDLSALVAKQKKMVPRKYFKESRIMRITIQCMLALGYMHSQHIMHRDIKSANVFLHNQGTRGEIVKLGDFGIAKVLDNTFQKARTVAGTPYYMSPEICKDQPYTIKSDVWSLGILLHELALLDFPFNASNLLGLVQKVVKQPAKRLPTIFSKEFQTIAREMLSKDPRKRPDIRHLLRKPYVREGVQRLLEETQYKVKSIAEDKQQKTPRGLATRMKKIQDDISKLKVGRNRPRPSRQNYKNAEDERRRQHQLQQQKAEQQRREKEEKQRLKKEEQNKKMKQKYAERRRKQREAMLRDRKRSKEKLDKRPQWNNDWHQDDDVEVLVSDQQYESVKLQQQQQQLVQQEQQELVQQQEQQQEQQQQYNESPPRKHHNVIDRYLKHGSTDFQLNNGKHINNNLPPKQGANPFSSNGAFKNASGSAVAKKKSSSSNDDDDQDGTREIMFDRNNDGAAKMPRSPNKFYRPSAAQHQRQPYEQYSKQAMQEQQHNKYNYLNQHQPQQRQQQRQQQYNNNGIYVNNSNLPPPSSNRNYIQPRQLQQNQQAYGNSGWRSNEPSPYGYQQQYRHQKQQKQFGGGGGGGGGMMYNESPQREQYRRDIAADERRKIFEQNQQAMLRNKRRHEEELRRHHPSALGEYLPNQHTNRATSAPLRDSVEANRRSNDSRSSAEDRRKEKLRRRESDDIAYREKLKQVREQAHQDRLMVLAKKEERERVEAQQRAQQYGQQHHDVPSNAMANKPSSKPRTRKQMMEEKRLLQEKKDQEYKKQLERARKEAYEQRQQLQRKHQKRQNSQESTDSNNSGGNDALKNTGKQNSEELANAQTDAVMKAVMAETMSLDLTTSIAISEDDLWRNNSNDNTDEQSAEDMVGLAESLINVLGGEKVTSKFFSNSSAVDPNHDAVRVPGGKNNKPKRINIDDMKDGADGFGEDVLVVNKNGKSFNKPVTPLDQSSDSLGVLFRKARGHGTRVDL